MILHYTRNRVVGQLKLPQVNIVLFKIANCRVYAIIDVMDGMGFFFLGLKLS